MKKYIIGFILGAIIFGSIGVAASQIFAKDIYFEPKEGWTLEENTVEAAINDLYSKSNKKVIFISTGWKGATGWNDHGFSRSFVVNNNFLTYDNFTITFLKDCKIKIGASINNTDSQSSSPQYDLIKNGSSILKFSNTTSSNNTVTKSITIDVTTGDTIYSRMYGGGKAAYYATWIEIVNE